MILFTAGGVPGLCETATTSMQSRLSPVVDTLVSPFHGGLTRRYVSCVLCHVSWGLPRVQACMRSWSRRRRGCSSPPAWMLPSRRQARVGASAQSLHEPPRLSLFEKQNPSSMLLLRTVVCLQVTSAHANATAVEVILYVLRSLLLRVARLRVFPAVVAVGAQICVRDVNKKRSFELEGHTTMVTDYDGETRHETLRR